MANEPIDARKPAERTTSEANSRAAVTKSCPVHGSTSDNSRAFGRERQHRSLTTAHKCKSHGNQLELDAAVRDTHGATRLRWICVTRWADDVPWITRW